MTKENAKIKFYKTPFQTSFMRKIYEVERYLPYFIAGFPVMNDPLYNHTVFGPEKGKGGNIGKSDEKLIADLISIHNAENWLGMDGDSELSMFNKGEGDESIEDIAVKLLDGNQLDKKDGKFLVKIIHSPCHR